MGKSRTPNAGEVGPAAGSRRGTLLHFGIPEVRVELAILARGIRVHVVDADIGLRGLPRRDLDGGLKEGQHPGNERRHRVATGGQIRDAVATAVRAGGRGLLAGRLIRELDRGFRNRLAIVVNDGT